MNDQHHFDTRAAAEREATLILNTIDDLYRKVRLLDAEIAAEERRLQIFDRTNAAYPILAQTLAKRGDNLLKTIDAMNKRFFRCEVRLSPSPKGFEPAARRLDWSLGPQRTDPTASF
jgi:hypothetical protein